MKIGAYEVSSTTNDQSWKPYLTVVEVGGRFYIGLRASTDYPENYDMHDRLVPTKGLHLYGVFRMIDDAVPMMDSTGQIAQLSPVRALVPALSGQMLQSLWLKPTLCASSSSFTEKGLAELADLYQRAVDPPTVQLARK